MSATYDEPFDRVRASYPARSAAAATVSQATTTDERRSTTTSAGSTTADGSTLRRADGKRARAKTERRREQCRQNQARYRDRQKASTTELKSNVEQLRREVAQLAVQRQSLYACINTRESAARTMLEYFRLFRYGLFVDKEISGLVARRRLPLLDMQLAYVSASFDHDVRVDDASGRAFFLEQSRRFRTLYDGLVMIQTGYEVLTTAEQSTTINVKIQLDVTVSLLTIRFVFPHILHREHDAIRRKLLGARLRCPSSGVFEFDAQGQVVGIRWTIDFVVALQGVLTLEEIAVVLQQAQIARDAYLLEAGDDHGREGDGDDEMERGD